jgi:hypothetical protein
MIGHHLTALTHQEFKSSNSKATIQTEFTLTCIFSIFQTTFLIHIIDAVFTAVRLQEAL